MSDITRRQILGVSTAAAATAAAQHLIPSATAEAALAPEAASEPASTVRYKYHLPDAPLEQYNGGTLRKVVVEQFPASPSMSGGIIHLEPGGMREPHWHPNAIEWDYVIAGRFRFNVLDPAGHSETFEVTVGDIIVVPQGFAHYFENIGTEPGTLLLTFNVGHFDEIGISDWVAKAPKDSFTIPLNLPEGALDKTPDHRLFITSRSKPGQ